MTDIYIIDTNVLMRYLLKDDDEQFLIAKSYLTSPSIQLYLPIQAICEMVWIMKKKLKFPSSYIVQILEGILSQPNIDFDKEIIDFAMPFLKQNGDFADGVIAYCTSQIHQSTLLTFDKKLHKICQKFNVLHIPLKSK
ncbi:Predicted nucleic-acid-binding protein, contains PIN domain [Moraxella lacunata]|uniref:Predicted nucleic-acid-binding protein, contains PIN domain n=1 Tax=Moraxella lacunata TaxID=477 RepID=A0A378T7N5_MORLA|nr:type II toxin-antitoxin system VapC family toxin [Moraxella lacunata]STZ56434.1 Predicted nucleic-acid-binding protein, contains PIN domain [Moraxella lacunata]